MKFKSPLLVFLVMLAVADSSSLMAQDASGRGGTGRANSLRILKGCATRPSTLGCTEDTAQHLIDLYNRGDRVLLKPLLDAGNASDGALTELLGTFYGEVLWKDPKAFLDAIHLRPLAEQRNLSELAGGTDGSGMRNDQLRAVRRSLQRLSARRSHYLSAVAMRCLIEVNRANNSANR